MRTPGPRSGCQGRGWVRVDPTAAVAPERIYDTLADRARRGRRRARRLRHAGAGDVGDWLRRGWNDFVLGFDASASSGCCKPLGIDELDGRSLVLLFALAATLALLWMVWLSCREQREARSGAARLARLGARYRRLGLGARTARTAGDWAERVAARGRTWPPTCARSAPFRRLALR